MEEISNNNEIGEKILFTVRDKFFEDVELNPELYDEIDVKSIKSDISLIYGFVQARQSNIEESYTMLRDAMRWRKSFGVNHITLADIPSEFTEIAEAHGYEPDLNGSSTVYVRVKLHKRFGELKELSQKYIVYLMEQAQREGRLSGKGWGIVWECSGGTLFNVDLEMLSFVVNTWTSYYPYSCQFILVHELPWILRAIYTLAKSWIPVEYTKIIRFANKNELAGIIGSENLPKYLGGDCLRNPSYSDEKSPKLAELSEEQNLNESQIQKFFNHYAKYLKPKNDI